MGIVLKILWYPQYEILQLSGAFQSRYLWDQPHFGAMLIGYCVQQIFVEISLSKRSLKNEASGEYIIASPLQHVTLHFQVKPSRASLYT